jgi:hypothetical protein
MQRRGWLRLGAALAVLTAGGVGWGVYRWPAARVGGHFQPDTSAVLMAAGRAVLDGLLPEQQPLADLAIQRWLQQLEDTVAALPPATQAELDLLLAALTQPVARAALTGAVVDWASAPTADLQRLLQQLRTSVLAERQQVYHALRDLSTAAYLADADTWRFVGYPGPALRFESA